MEPPATSPEAEAEADAEPEPEMKLETVSDQEQEPSTEMDDVFSPMEYYSGPLRLTLKSQLSIFHKLYLDLKKVHDGYTKKMRFTIVTLCPSCQAANHVKDMDIADERKLSCITCRETQIFVAKTGIYSIFAPPGTQHGSRMYFREQGSFGPHGIRGDIVVTFFDEPHEHFLRVEDDIVVCFQIDHEESISGASRLLNIVVPHTQDILLTAECGESIRNNEVRYVAGLGLPNWNNALKRGRLIVVFFVKSRKSMLPVKLKNIRINLEVDKTTLNDNSEEILSTSSSPEPTNTNVQHANNSNMEGAGNSNMEGAGNSNMEGAGNSNMEEACNSNMEKASHSNMEKASHSNMEKASHSNMEKASHSNMEKPCNSSSSGSKRSESTTNSNSKKPRLECSPIRDGSDDVNDSDGEPGCSQQKEGTNFSRSRDQEVPSSSSLPANESTSKNINNHQYLRVEKRIRLSDLKKHHPDALNLLCVPFLDRLVITGALPMPYLTKVSEIPMAELELLRQKRFYPSWWEGITKVLTVLDDIDNVMTVRYPAPSDRPSRRATDMFNHVPLFTLEDVDLDEEKEAVQSIITRHSEFNNPDIGKFALIKLSREGKRKILLRLKEAVLHLDI